jgi:peptidoglycan/xylan/chitin deacetylase (PgdA/CDA1 family)
VSGHLPRYVWARGLECLALAVRTGVRAAGGARIRGAVFSAAPGCVALTIDDGPHPQWTPAVLDLLGEQGITATFFLVGSRVREQPGLARRIVSDGHAIGNHSMDHPMPFAALDRRSLAAEIGTAQLCIEDAAGVSPRLFRAPGGSWSPSVLRAAAHLGLTAVDWTLNTGDWKRPGAVQLTRTLSGTRPRDVVLCHDGGGDRAQTVHALATALPRLRRRGLEFVRL